MNTKFEDILDFNLDMLQKIIFIKNKTEKLTKRFLISCFNTLFFIVLHWSTILSL